MSMKNKDPSKYIKTNLESGEDLKFVIMSTKGIFGSDDDDIAITNKRIFAHYKNGKSFGFPLDKIKNIEVVPDKGLFGGAKDSGEIRIYGPYNRKITFKSDALEDDKSRLRRLLKLS